MRDIEELEEHSRISPEMIGLFFKDAMNREEGKVAPDTTGADKFFIDGFLTDEMSYDFWVIARDFMKHHFPELAEYYRLSVYENDYAYQSDPERALQIRILSIMYNASKTGDPYAVELMKTLYKTYHKKEYNQLKRFKTISVNEIFSLSEDGSGGCGYSEMGRILGMCAIYGIQMDEKCSILYLLLERNREEWDEEEEVSFFNFKEGLFRECMTQVEKWQEEEKGKHYLDQAEKYWKVQRFADLCLEYQSYPSDFIYRCNKRYSGTKMLFAQTLALLKSAFPKERFTYEDVQLYAHICQEIEAIVNVCDDYEDNIAELFGIRRDRHESDGTECLFKPESIVYTGKPQKKAPVKPINVAPVANGEAKDEDYLQEIAELRRRLREKEQESRHFKAQYDQVNASLKEARELIAKYENDREELIALRNHVYNLSEEVPAIETEKLEDMMSEIAMRNIAIVGGHVNWTNKLKKQFPNWKFFDANISRINEGKLLEGVDKVYFYTDHLSHGTYDKYIALVRENHIPFGYLHAVNVETMVRQIYGEISER